MGVKQVITIVLCIFVVVYTRYWDTVLEMSWPRFTYVVELNVDSVRNTDPQKLGVIDIRPHYVSTLNKCFCFPEYVLRSDSVLFNSRKYRL